MRYISIKNNIAVDVFPFFFNSFSHMSANMLSQIPRGGCELIIVSVTDLYFPPQTGLLFRVSKNLTMTGKGKYFLWYVLLVFNRFILIITTDGITAISLSSIKT